MTKITTTMQGPMPEEQFFQEVKRHLLRIEAELVQVAPLLSNTEHIEHMYRQFHTLAGAASLMGFPFIGGVAQEGELLLEKLLDGEAHVTSQTASFFHRVLKQLWWAIEN